MDRLEVKGSGVKVTDLLPLPKPDPHGDILRFIYEKDEEAAGNERKEGRQAEKWICEDGES